jgi:hypothetical protein
MPWQCSHCGGVYGIGEAGPFGVPEDFAPLSPLLGPAIAHRWCFYSGFQNHYVYALCYGSGLPFYVGRGQKLRALAHEAETRSAKLAKRTEKHSVIAWLKLHEEPVWYHFLALTPDVQEAIAAENHYLRTWGLRSQGGLLTNSAGATSSDCDYPITPPNWPHDDSEIQHFAEKVGKWSHAVRPLRSPDYVVPPPTSRALVSGAVSRCLACGELYQFLRVMSHKKGICANCGHYLMPDTDLVDDGSQRNFIRFQVD